MTVTTKLPPAPTWDLESLFPGGSRSPQFKEFRDKVSADLDTTMAKVKNLPDKLDDNTASDWQTFIFDLQDLQDRVHDVMSFAHCLTTQNVEDSEAHSIEAYGVLLSSRWEKIRTEFEALVLKQSDEVWEKFVNRDDLATIRFYLNELRRIAKEKMPIEMERLALDLAVNGYHAWNMLYDKMAGDLRAEFEEDGLVKQLSMGQLAAKMSDADRDVRRKAFEALTKAWSTRADLSAMALNAQAGFRLSLYENRGWKSPLYEPLNMARLKQQTLDTMWTVIEKEAPHLKAYIDAKKKILGIDKFTWYDEYSSCGNVEKLYSFDEAGKFIVDNVRNFSDDMAQFMEMALEKRWIEAEDRPGKAGGGYCTGVRTAGQSRIFMTYSGTYENLLTVAHELGHAYHSYVLKDRPSFAAGYPMPLAETASIFSETLVTDAALATTEDPREKLMLLDQKLQASYVMFTDIYSRYLFDCAFYEARKKSTLDRKQLSDMMVQAQKRAFAGLLDDSGYHPLFWCTKLHFYITDVPFYNFPYTFGFLFAGGVYDRAKKEGKAFADKYRALLADTGRMTTEEVAQKHLGVDLTQEAFWHDAVNRSLADIDDFVKLAGKA